MKKCWKCGKEITGKGKTGLCLCCSMSRERNPMFGRTHTKEVKEKCRAAAIKGYKEGKTGWHNVKGSNHNDSLTDAEEAFWKSNPDLKQGAPFATGKGGMKKWGCGYFRADFYDEMTNTVYEINGSIHNKIKTMKKDERKRAFYSEKGVILIELSNEEALNGQQD